jgi:hypothetical protein
MSINNIESLEKLPQYVFLTGRGRSGTTWLGQILNTYHNCVYKYEPFLPSKSSPFQTWKDRLDGNYDLEELRSSFWSLCSKCYFGVDNPPFPEKSFRQQPGALLHLFYGLGKRIDPLKYLYEFYGRPQLNRDTAVLIKDVNFPIYLLPHLSQVLQPYLIAMVRNPFANIASYLKGIKLGLFDSDRQQDINRFKNSLNTPEGKQLAHYSSQLESMSVAQFEALRWRFQAEALVEYAKNYPKSMIVVYEDLCLDPLSKTKKIFDFLGWQIDPRTEDFVDASTSGKVSNSNSSKSYYSVYRDPRKSMSKWREQLTETQKLDIQSIIRESPLKSLWSDDFLKL